MIGLTLRACQAALGDLVLPGIHAVLLVSILGAAAIFLAGAAGLGWLAAQITVFGVPWLDHALQGLGAATGLALAWLCFPMLVAMVAGSLTDRVAASVERAHYPPAGRNLTLLAGIGLGLRLGLVGIALILITLPIHLLLPGISLALTLALNGWLLGRGMFQAVALRRLPAADAAALRRAHAGTVWLAGCVLALLAYLPLANLLTPILATAVMVHLAERLERARY